MKEDKLLAHDPLADADDILSAGFYGRPARRAAGTLPPPLDDGPAPRRGKAGAAADKGDKPTHYKVICISMYTQDLAELDAKVAELKQRGWTKANKSHLIRLALAQLDLDKLPTPRQ
jgi:hypothetical protein